jgi:predicted nucleic acid-binding protein
VGLIYVDACLVIYAFENHPRHAPSVREAFATAAGTLVISPLVKLECLVGPMRSGNLVLQRHYEQGLARFQTLPMDEQVFIQAAELRARFGLKTPDALHLAAAQRHGCTALWTNDDRLASAAHGLASNVLAVPG